MVSSDAIGLSGAFGVTKVGGASATMDGTHSYSGATTVSTGTLNLNGANTRSGLVTVNSGATLNLTGVNAFNGGLALSGLATGPVAVGTSLSGAGTAGAVTVLSGATVTPGSAPSTFGTLALGALTFVGGTVTWSSTNTLSGSGTVRVNTGSTLFLATGRNLLCNVELFGGTTGEAFGQLRVDANTTNFGPILLRANSTIGNQGGTTTFGYLNGVISDGGLGLGFTKQGNGAIVLSAANTFSGQTTFTAGTTALQLNHVNALAQSTVNLTVANGLTFNPAAGTTFTLGGLTGTAALALQNTAAAAISLSVGNNNASTTYSAALSGVGSLTKVGSGVLNLSGSSTHTGTTFANGGVLQLAPAGALTVSTIQVGPAGTFDGSLVTGGFAVRANQNLSGFGVVTGSVTVPLNAGIAPGTVGTAGTLSFSNALSLTGGTLRFDLADVTTPGGGVNDLIALNGPLSLSGANLVQLNLLTGTMAAGTYTLISGITSVPAGSVANLQLASPVRQVITFDLVDQAAPGVSGVTNLVMNVSGTGGSVAWVGTGALWDAGVSFNWKNLGTMKSDRFFTFDQTLFDDSFAANPAVSLVGALFPNSVTVNNVNSNYTFTGSGRISGATGVTKDGAGLLVVSTANDYTGATIIRDGTLRTTVGTALGSVAGATFVTNSGTLDTFAQNLGNELVVISGAGAGGGGAIRNSGADQTQTLTALRLAGDASVNGPNRWDVRSTLAGGSFVDLNGYTFTKIGTNFVSFVNALVTSSGSIVINQGLLGFELTTTVGGSGSGTVNPSATLNVGSFGGTLTVTKPIALNGGTLATSTSGASGTCALDSPVTLLAASAINVLDAATLTLRGSVGGASALTKQGPGALVLAGTNTYQGLTTISAGTLALSATGSISNSAGVSLAAGTTLDAAARGGLSFGSGRSLSGSGTVVGSVMATAGSQVHPGGLSPGTLTLSSGLSLTDVAAMDFQIGSVTNEGAGFNDLIQVNGALALSGVSTVRVSMVGAPIVGAIYTLFSYTGAFTGAAGNLAVVTDTRSTFTIDLSVPGKVRLVITGGAGSLLWVGGNPDNVWDTRTTANWDPGTGDPDVFFPGDLVSFVNGSSYPTVNLTGLLQPADLNAIADDNYLFEGTGRINGGRLNKSGSGTLTLANSDVNNFAFGTVISQGTLQIGNGGTAGALPTGPLTNNATLAFDRSDDLTVSATLNGSGVVRKQGVNTLTLSAANGQAGGTVVAGGTLRLQNNAALGNPASAVTTVNDGASLDLSSFELWNYIQPLVINGSGTGGAGAITKSAAGTQNLLHLRSITLGSDATIGGVTNGRIDIGRGDWGNATVTAPLHIDGQGYTLSVTGGVYLGILAGAQNLAGIAIGGGSLVAPHADNSFGGAMVTLNGGTLTPWGANHLFVNPLVLNSGFIDNQGFSNAYTGALQINGPVQINTIAGGNITMAGGGGGAGRLTKIGPNLLTLLGTNSHGGGTAVSNGTLRVDGVLGSGSGVVTVAGAVLTGNGTILDAVNIAANGVLSPGASVGVLTLSNTLTLAGTNVMEIDKAGGTNDSVRGLTGVTYGGALVVQNLGGTLGLGDSFKLFDAASYGGSFASLQLPALGAGLYWNIAVLALLLAGTGRGGRVVGRAR